MKNAENTDERSPNIVEWSQIYKPYPKKCVSCGKLGDKFVCNECLDLELKLVGLDQNVRFSD